MLSAHFLVLTLISAVTAQFNLSQLISGPADTVGVVQGGPLAMSSGVDYLAKFGYVEPRMLVAEPSVGNEAEINRRLMAFQIIAHVTPTGQLDSATMAAMMRPRCGNRDDKLVHKILGEASRRKKRFVLAGSKWERNDLTYRFHSFSQDLPIPVQKDVISRAFSRWADVTPLTFTLVEGDANINIVFGTGNHGDNFPFDGPGRVLAHAFIPPDGRLHFDDGEQFTDRNPSGVNLDYVACHEIGHVLGLDHSEVQDSVMAPFIREYSPELNLHSDDITAIQQVYGPPVSGQTTRTTIRQTSSTLPVTPPTLPPMTFANPCKVMRWDALVKTQDGKSYLFKGNVFYELISDKQLSRTPFLVADHFPKLPDVIESAVTLPEGHTAFNSDYWTDIFRNKERVDDKMYYTQDLFLEAPAWRMDASWVWNGSLFFSSGKQFWRVGEGCSSKSIRRGWKSPAALQRIDAAGYVGNKLYFLYKRRAFLVNDALRRTTNAGKIGSLFFGCSNAEMIVRASERSDEEFDDPELAQDNNVLQLLENEGRRAGNYPGGNSVFDFARNQQGPLALSDEGINNSNSFLNRLHNNQLVRSKRTNTNDRGSD